MLYFMQRIAPTSKFNRILMYTIPLSFLRTLKTMSSKISVRDDPYPTLSCPSRKRAGVDEREEIGGGRNGSDKGFMCPGKWTKQDNGSQQGSVLIVK